jgi:protein-arginine kinase activator protein McsA
MFDYNGYKTCTACNIEKDMCEFSYDIRRPDGRQARCRSCANTLRKTRTKEFNRDSNLKYLYGLGIEGYEKLYQEQEKKCQICQKEFEKLHVDHCHDKKTIRGLLCQQCNLGLGSFKDNVEILERAIKYVKDNQ